MKRSPLAIDLIDAIHAPKDKASDAIHQAMVFKENNWSFTMKLNVKTSPRRNRCTMLRTGVLSEREFHGLSQTI